MIFTGYQHIIQVANSFGYLVGSSPSGFGKLLKPMLFQTVGVDTEKDPGGCRLWYTFGIHNLTTLILLIYLI